MFQSIGFHAALILNRLRNERLVKEGTERDAARSHKQNEKEQEAHAELARVNERLAKLAVRADAAGRKAD